VEVPVHIKGKQVNVTGSIINDEIHTENVALYRNIATSNYY
jgi:hypothetical protein